MSKPRAADAVEALMPAFARWLRRRGLSRRPVGNAVSRVRRVSIAYGDLVERLAYGAADEARRAPNPSSIHIEGSVRDGLASLRTALEAVRRVPRRRPMTGRRRKRRRSVPRVGAVLSILLLLPSCQLPRVAGSACDAGGRLGFALGDTPGWFGIAPARPRSVSVNHVGIGERVWFTRAPPHIFLARLLGGGEPQRPVLLYGAALPGWRTAEPAAALRRGERYWAHIWTDGGLATIEWTHGAPLPACPLR